MKYCFHFVSINYLEYLAVVQLKSQMYVYYHGNMFVMEERNALTVSKTHKLF